MPGQIVAMGGGGFIADRRSPLDDFMLSLSNAPRPRVSFLPTPAGDSDRAIAALDQLAAPTARVVRDGRDVVLPAAEIVRGDLVRVEAGDVVPADLLLAEAAFRDDSDNPPNIHMTGSEAADIASRAKVSRLVLTHIPPWHEKDHALEESKGHYDGPVDLAVEGLTFEL